MRVAIIGAGPAGLFTGAALAARGHEALVFDRDPGPRPDGSWPRRGVMQFHHAHGFRTQVLEALQQEVPAARDAWIAAGAEVLTGPVAGGDEGVVGIRSRRSTFEAALRAGAVGVPGLTVACGHVEEVLVSGGRAVGLRIDGDTVDADLVIDASGRAGRSTRALRPPPAVGGDCGIAYVDRQYQLRPGAEPGPLTGPLAFQGNYDGYQILAFPHEDGIFSVVIIRSTADRALVGLRHDAAFDAVAAAVPALAAWTDPERAHPITAVLPGGTLMNVYRSQAAVGDRPLPGLVFLGDAVCTTTPIFGRGVATTIMQCVELLRLIDEAEGDLEERFDTWCDAEMKPWVIDHVQMDDGLRDRWDGHDVDLTRPLPSDLIMAAAAVDPSIGAAIPPYASMAAGPGSLRAVEHLARAVYETGWRPPLAPGPSRDDLVDLVRAAAPVG